MNSDQFLQSQTSIIPRLHVVLLPTVFSYSLVSAAPSGEAVATDVSDVCFCFFEGGGSASPSGEAVAVAADFSDLGEAGAASVFATSAADEVSVPSTVAIVRVLAAGVGLIVGRKDILEAPPPIAPQPLTA